MRRRDDMEAMVAMDDGVRVWTATGGRGALPVVLCHGGPGLWDYLGPVAEALKPIARVHRWEQRGCGRSDRVGPYAIDRYVADLECLRRHFGHRRWLVGGHSWGAGLALRYALAHPQRTLGVLYMSGTGFGQAWRETYRSAAEEQEWFAAAPYAINHECNRALDEEEKQTIEADMLERCRSLDVPVGFLHGARDPRPVWAVEPLVAALPQARLTVLEGVGHLPWLEDPAAFAPVVRELAGGLSQP